ncbi:MAG TPA: type II secretion system protein GspG [Pyrinomonadaceae bacterium]|nr:type II secretion system protein GspG [Pyrinomonadaceae bacterium]
MRNNTRRTILNLSVCAALCALAAAGSAGLFSAAAVAEKAIKKDEARKLIAAVSLFELNKEAVTIREISPPSATATVLAGVKLGFRFAKDESGTWRAVEVRTGDRQWESFDLLARALGAEQVAAVRAELDAFAAELAALSPVQSATVDGDARKNRAGDAPQNQEGERPKTLDAGKEQTPPPKELRRGALSVANPAAALAPQGSAAVVELEVDVSVDFVRDVRGRWQVARVRLGREGGGRAFEAFEAFERALDGEKRARARADLESLATALEAYRRERGFYVVAGTGSDLVNHLNPRYTAAFVRFDPWHRAYEYVGERERFTLRSLGADGKPNTPDDVTIGKQ